MGGRWRLTANKHKEVSWGDGNILNEIVGIIANYKFALKKYWIVHLKWIYLIVHKFYLNNTIENKHDLKL